MATVGAVGTDAAKERFEFLGALAQQRSFLRQTVAGISDEQARQRTTVSDLCLGGLIKHVAVSEHSWTDFIVHGPSAPGPADPASVASHEASFTMLPDDTLAAVLGRYDDVARRTEDLVRSLDSLDVTHPLPEAPWFQPGTRWSARQVLLHILAETAQHSGHADIIREALDGAKTMG